MKKYRPTHTLNYYYARSMIFGAEITCYPQSVWTLIDDRIYSVKLKSENVTIEIEKDDFEKFWSEVEE